MRNAMLIIVIIAITGCATTQEHLAEQKLKHQADLEYNREQVKFCKEAGLEVKVNKFGTAGCWTNF